MYVLMHACVNSKTYVCLWMLMYVLMYAYVNGYTVLCVFVDANVRFDVCMCGWVHGLMCVCGCLCMF